MRQVLQWTNAACTDLLLKIHRVLKHPFKECMEWLCFMSLLHFWLPFTLINFELNWGQWQKPIAIKNSAVIFVLKNTSQEGSNIHGNRLVFLSVLVCEDPRSLLNMSCSRWLCSGSAWARHWALGKLLDVRHFVTQLISLGQRQPRRCSLWADRSAVGMLRLVSFLKQCESAPGKPKH